MIITKISSGLGNQLFQYATSRAISIRSDVTLKLDIDFYETDTQRKYRLNKFNIIENLATRDEIRNLKKEGEVKKNFYRRLLNRLNPSGIEVVSKNHIKEKIIASFSPKVFRFMDNFYLEGYWQNQLYFKSIRKVLLEELTLKHPFDARTNELLEKVLNCNSVSIHIRRGDYLNIDFFSNLSLEYYYDSISYIKKIVDNPVFFVFSDDIIWAKMNLNLTENIHFVEQNTNESDILDLEIMKNCNHNIIANSSFSWWGAWLNRNPGKIVIAPKKWYNNPIAQKNIEKGHLVPLDWIKL